MDIKRFDEIGKILLLASISLIFTSCTFFVSEIRSLNDGSFGDSIEPGPPSVSFSTNLAAVSEATSAVLVNVSLSKVTTQTVTVDFAISGSSTATSGSVDYDIGVSTLTFAPGEISKAISVDIIDDLLDESNEEIILILSNPVAALIGIQATTTVQITDDDLPPVAEFSSASQTISEAAGTLNVTVNLSAASSKTILVPISLNGSSSASGAGVDYTLNSSSMTFNPGEITKQLTIALVNDGFAEADESIVLDVGTVTNATVGAMATHSITLTSEDVAPTAPTALVLGNIPYSLDQTPTLSWTAVAGASYYEARIFDSTDTTPVSTLQTLTSGSAIASLALAANTVYTFRVRAVDTFGNLGAWASITWTSFCDPVWANTVLAMELNGANLSTAFSDVSNSNKNPLTAAGNARLSTTEKFNGSASAYFDGSGDYITTPTSSDWEISGDYTIEARIYVASGQLNPIATAWNAGNGWGFYVGADGSLYFNIKNGATDVTATSAAGAVSAAAWHHVAAVRSGSDLFVYLDGTRIATGIASPTVTGTFSTWLGGSTTNSFSGYIDDFKVTKGTARYTGGSYTVPNKTLLCQ